MSKSLITILDESFAIERALIESMGEITKEISDKVLINEIEKREKIDGYEILMSRLELNEQFFKQKEDQAKVMKNSCAKLRESMRDRIKYLMIENGLEEISGSDVRFKLTKTTPSLKIDSDLITDEYKYQLVSIEIDKEKVKADLKSGKEVAGASLEQGVALRKYSVGAK